MTPFHTYPAMAPASVVAHHIDPWSMVVCVIGAVVACAIGWAILRYVSYRGR